MQPEPTAQTRDAPGVPYRLESSAFTGLSATELREWGEFLERTPSTSAAHDPAWLAEWFADEKDRLFVYRLYQENTLRGVAPFLLKAWPVKCQLGEITLAKLPCRRLCLLGGGPLFPEDPEAYDALFRELSARAREFDAIYLPDIPVGSMIWEGAGRAAESRRFLRYSPAARAPKVLLRLDGTFEEYMSKFSSKHRKHLRRAAEKLEEKGAVEVVRCTEAEQIDSFLEHAIAISRKTYQWNLLGLGLRSKEKIDRQFSFLARNGWLRSYLLLCGGAPCAFILGFRHGSGYFLEEMGYDPDWRDLQVGKLLHLRVIEDLFTCDRPAVYDLGEYGLHKDEFGTDSVDQGQILLFRRALYPRFVRIAHRICSAVSDALSRTLERYGLKQKIKKMIRAWRSG
jgi:CelD/BcsL family acetyltransferase involved in cellulose biosynthesis